MQREIIRRRKLHEEVAARLESLIHSGQFAVGSKLPSERDLMERFGVGRPAVREALLALERMGLVAISSGERARVTKPTPEVLVGQLAGAARNLLSQPEGIRHFQEARLFFETGLSRLAAEHADTADIAALRRALTANRAALGDMPAFERTDVAFHYELALISRNPIFTALHQAMVEWLTRQRTVSLRGDGVDRLAYRSHRRICEAVAAGAPDRAEAAMRQHLLEVADHYWKNVEGDT